MDVLAQGVERITDSSDVDDNWPKNRICTGDGNSNDGCGAALKLEEADMYQTSHNFHGYAVEGVQPYLTRLYSTFRCPCCNAETDLCEGETVPYKETVASKDSVNSAA